MTGCPWVDCWMKILLPDCKMGWFELKTRGPLAKFPMDWGITSCCPACCPSGWRTICCWGCCPDWLLFWMVTNCCFPRAGTTLGLGTTVMYPPPTVEFWGKWKTLKEHALFFSDIGWGMVITRFRGTELQCILVNECHSFLREIEFSAKLHVQSKYTIKFLCKYECMNSKIRP